MTAWVALEGGEGSGKSTQSRLLAEALGALLTREPGGTPVGERVRSLLLDPTVDALDGRAEALLMAADRAQHMADVVAPALAAGRDVVSDRSAWSSLAYQGYGRGLPIDELRKLSDWALRGRWPDLAVLVRVPDDVVAARLVEAGRAADRFEAEGEAFHRRVREGFEALAAAEPERWAVVDGSGSVADVAARVLTLVRSRVRA
ncbi:MAG TPA: dTMP kinase [Acidimicrobiales bacterium]|nr:dTMP kinase [Acidimicrobiales bacterium]